MADVFISYSRSETPLVDEMATLLEAAGVDTFLDFRDLEPAGEWAPQLDRELADARAVLLVVSRRSVWESRNVAVEWQHALARGTRVVLAVAEAVALPDELAGAEWIDLRYGFEARVAELAELLAHPAAPASPPPADGRAPRIVRIGAGLAVFASLSSLVTIWTVVLPLVLVPLPRRILRRRFDYTAVRTALWVLPVALLDTLLSQADLTFGLALFVAVPAIVALLLVMRSRSFGRWMTPAAGRTKPRRVVPVDRRPSPVRYATDHAPQDEGYVEVLTDAMSDAGHHRVGTGDEPDVVLRFVSNFHDTVELGAATTIPVILSDPDDELPPQLQRTQWVDLRRGGRRRRRRQARQFAALVDQPGVLLGELGIAPPHEQRLLPRAVQAVRIALWACLATVLSGPLLLLSDAGIATRGQWIGGGVTSALMVALLARTIDRLARRRHTVLWRAHLPAAVVGMFVLSSIFVVDTEELVATDSVILGHLVTAIVLTVVWLFARRELRLWMPRDPEPGGGPEHPIESLTAAVASGRRTLAAAVRDTFGREPEPPTTATSIPR